MRDQIPALAIKSLFKNYGHAEIIRGIDLEIAKGERHALIGPNGAGKTTFFGLISGLVVPSKGEILLNGARISGRPPHKINRRGLSRSFQATNIFPRMSVFENIRCGLLWSKGEEYCFWRSIGSRRDIRDLTLQILNEIGMASRAQDEAGLLTYAEQRALEIGITIAGGASVILLDEPTAGMSRAETGRVVDLVRRISEGRTLVIVEHDMSVVFDLADRISVLVYGEIIASGSPADIRANAKVRQAYLGQPSPDEDAHA